MAMGLPTVCSNSDGVLDIAVNGDTSFLFENKNSRDLTKKIEVLINSADTRNLFGKKGRERIVNNFNLETQTDKIIEIYKTHK
ncbi:MAG TPA: glycosyltransferase, partial [Ignavibacteria bacterium]|nr:glycosyltransferase [Ignavibacteria bacterium]